MTQQRILATIKDCHGEETPVAILTQNGGLLRLWEVVCLSSRDHNLGNCLCINHDATEETPVSTSEVIERFGIEALDGFEAPRDAQLVFDAVGVEIDALETFLRIAYNFNINPLPALRERTEAEIVFGYDPNLLVFPEAKPGTIVFVVNDRGEIAARKV